MSAHMKMHHIKADSCEVIMKMPGKKKISSYIPLEYVGQLEKFLTTHSEGESLDWKIFAKDSIQKHKQAGLVLRGARFRENMTQKELAKQSGISQENISRIENGKRIVGEKVAKKLAKPLKIDYKMLIEEDI